MPESEAKASEQAPESGAGGGDADDGELKLEGRLRRLDEIVSALEADDLELDRALALFEEGVGHVRKARKILAEAELKVEELVGEEEALETRALEGGEEE